MSNFLDLPIELLIKVFGSFTYMNSLCNLNTAICTKGSQQSFSELFSHIAFVTFQTPIHTVNDKQGFLAFQWLIFKGIRLDKYTFQNNFWCLSNFVKHNNLKHEKNYVLFF
jgi:hypothetical protein